MLKEFIETISRMAVEANNVQVVAPAGEPTHRYALRDAKGILEWCDAEPEPRNHKARDLESLAGLAKMWADNPAAVWFSRNGVVLLVNDDTRRDRVTVPLALSPQLTDLASREKSKLLLNQADLVSLLRTTLARCVRGNLLEVVRRVNFNQMAAGHTEIQHGKSSIGKSLQAELTGAASLPEYVTFDVPVFAAHFYSSQPVECALEVFPETQKFALVTLPWQVEGAVASAESVLGEKLASLLGDSVPAYYGEP